MVRAELGHCVQAIYKKSMDKTPMLLFFVSRTGFEPVDLEQRPLCLPISPP